MSKEEYDHHACAPSMQTLDKIFATKRQKLEEEEIDGKACCMQFLELAEHHELLEERFVTTSSSCCEVKCHGGVALLRTAEVRFRTSQGYQTRARQMSYAAATYPQVYRKGSRVTSSLHSSGSLRRPADNAAGAPLMRRPSSRSKMWVKGVQRGARS